MRGIDHAVIAVADLDTAAEDFASLGFTVTPRADHPFGTSNRLIIFEGSYLELVAVTRPDLVPTTGFAADIVSHLAHRGPGFAGLALTCEDPERDLSELRASGVMDGEPLVFERPAPLPDGRILDAAFSTLFTTAATPFSLFLCHHHTPEAVWDGSAMSHPNGAHRLTGARMPALGDAATLANLAHSEVETIDGHRLVHVSGAVIREDPEHRPTVVIDHGGFARPAAGILIQGP